MYNTNIHTIYNKLVYILITNYYVYKGFVFKKMTYKWCINIYEILIIY